MRVPNKPHCAVGNDPQTARETSVIRRRESREESKRSSPNAEGRNMERKRINNTKSKVASGKAIPPCAHGQPMPNPWLEGQAFLKRQAFSHHTSVSRSVSVKGRVVYPSSRVAFSWENTELLSSVSML